MEFFSSIRRKVRIRFSSFLLYKSFFPRVEEDVVYLDFEIRIL